MRDPAKSLACAACAIAVSASGLSPASASAAFGDRPLVPGSHGRNVRVLQRWLTRVGVPTRVDGVYGRATARSVRAYERAGRLHVDGLLSRPEARGLRRRVTALGPAPDAPTPPPATSPGARAMLSPDGRTALAPAFAPAQVQAAIAAANRLVRKPYRWGGGHGKWEDRGYDCSGAVSYALHGAGLLASSLTSGELTRYGDRGRGQWITIYAHGGHTFVVIAGLRFDTSGSGGRGPRWRVESRSVAGFKVRHPAGL